MPNSSETIVASVEAAYATGHLGLERAPDIIVALNARPPEAAAEILFGDANQHRELMMQHWKH